MNTDIASIYLKPKKEESLLRFHPWLFSGAIQRIDGTPAEGDTVRVYSSDGTLLGAGHYQPGSIAVRMLTQGEDLPDRDFYSRRLHGAMDVRRALGLDRADNNAYRLVHGEGDFVPGLIVDIYGSTAVMQAHSAGIHFARHIIADELLRLDSSIRNVYYKSETTLPFKADIHDTDGYLAGDFDTDVAVENGLKFHVDWLRGQKTGFFVDQRENRSLLEHYALGRDVLNMFCYTGGFSVYAMRGGARSVCSVDSSAKAISLTDKNIALNFDGDTRHTSYATDAFRFLADMSQDSYDLIILDPPAFAKRREALRNALRGYQRLNARAIEAIRPGGILFTFSCSQAVSREQFRLAIFSAAAQTGRRVRILHQLTQPADHPVNIYHPEGEYLKGLVLYIE